MKCIWRLLGAEYGAEDITVLRDGLAFLSTVCNEPSSRDEMKVIRLHWHLFSIQGLKFPGFPSLSEEPGKIYILDLLHPKPSPVELQIRGNLDLDSFNPHGISVYTDDAGDLQIME